MTGEAKKNAAAGDLPPAAGAGPGKAEPLGSRVVRGGMWAAGASWFALIVGFAANLVLMNMLAPEDYGVFALGFSFYSILGIRGKLAVGLAFGQSPEGALPGLAGTFLRLNLALAALTVAVCLAAAPLLSLAGYGRDALAVMLAMAGIGIIDAVGEIPGTMLGRRLMFRTTALIGAVAFPMSYLPAFVLAWHGGRHWSIVCQGALLSVVQAVLLWVAVRRQVPAASFDWAFSRSSARSLLRFGTVTGMASVVRDISSSLSGVLIGTFSSIREVGLYNRAVRFARWPAVVLDSVLSGAAFFTYSHLQQERERLGRAFTMLLWVTVAVAGPIAVGMFVSAPEIVRLLLKPDWEPCIPLIRVAVVYLALSPFIANMDSLFMGVGHPRVILAANLIELALFAAIGIPLTLKAGALGACVAAGVARVTVLVVRVAWVRRLVRISAVSEFLLPVACAAFAILAVMGVNRCTAINAWPAAARLVCKAALAVGCFYVAMYVTRPAQTVERVRYLVARIRERGGTGARPGGDGGARSESCESA